jgi:hypothetical protein
VSENADPRRVNDGFEDEAAEYFDQILCSSMKQAGVDFFGGASISRTEKNVMCKLLSGPPCQVLITALVEFALISFIGAVCPTQVVHRFC